MDDLGVALFWETSISTESTVMARVIPVISANKSPFIYNPMHDHLKLIAVAITVPLWATCLTIHRGIILYLVFIYIYTQYTHVH